MWRALDRWLCDDEAGEVLVAREPAWTRRDFVARVLYLSQQLHRAGVQTVALHTDDAALFACALLACAHRGITLCLPPNLAEDNREWGDGVADVWLSDQPDLAVRKPCWLLDDGAGAIECPVGRPSSAGTVPRVGGTPLKQGAATADAGARSACGPQVLSDERAAEVASAMPERADARRLRTDTRLLLKTSGSTGRAQVVEKTIAQFAAEAEALADAWSLRSMPAVEAALGSVSPQHLYGLSFRVVLSLCAGWPIHRPRCVYPESLLEAAVRHPRSVWIVSPVLLNSLGEDRVAAALRGQVVRVVSSGGSLPSQTRQRVQHQLAGPVSDIYGSTETGVIAWREGEADWQVLQPAQWGTDAHGALWVQSAWSNGRQQTGDAVQVQGPGFALLGRVDRILKLADKRVSLLQVEHHLLQHAWVADAHCGLHPRSQRLLGWLALSAGGIHALREQGRPAVVQALRQHLLRTQDAVAVPRAWRFDTVLPRNSQGKLAHEAFRQVLDRRLTAPEWSVPDLAATTFPPAPLVIEGEVPLDLVYFGGHFARFPLVPGVVEIDWVVTLARLYLDCPPHVIRGEALKFRQFVRPGDRIRVTLDWRADQHKLSFSLEGGQGVCASGRLLFALRREYA